MKILSIGIKNFRRLQEAQLDLSEKSTILVGSNNSGKTSAMYALLKFLGGDQKRFSINDVSLSNYNKIINLGKEMEKDDFDIKKGLDEFRDILPFLDVWIEVSDDEIRYVDRLKPTLDSTPLIGVRLSLEPNDIDKLYADYHEQRIKLKSAVDDANQGRDKEQLIEADVLWPKNLYDFLDRELMNYMSIKKYKLNPELKSKLYSLVPSEKAKIYADTIEKKQFESLIKVDVISAQRGFSDSEEVSDEKQNLSSQLRIYYDKHISPEGSFDKEDIFALNEIKKSFSKFEENIRNGFKQAVQELSDLGYPGVNDPLISFFSKFDPSEFLDHDSVVKFATKENGEVPPLPEKFNGLGYQNLISIIFKLIAFRDEWMQVGFSRREGYKSDVKMIQPIHLVLLEEPEAHLHVQVQQVFIKKAYDVLRNHKSLGEKKEFTTQLIISTHSSALTKECDFNDLRYFKRKLEEDTTIPISEVFNLSDLFNSERATIKFVSKYLRGTSFDLFFADALILVEGLAETVLLPHFINEKYKDLSKMFISILEISGRHAHLLKPLIDFIQIPTLVITDLDSANKEGNHEAEWVKKGTGQVTTNGVLTRWIPKEKSIDQLLLLDGSKKVNAKGNVRVAYQIEEISYPSKGACPRTFEDAMMLSNFVLFRDLADDWFETAGGTKVDEEEKLIEDSILKKVSTHIKKIDKENLDPLETLYKMVDASNFSKTNFSTDLLYFFDMQDIQVPSYIDEGFKWLENFFLIKHKEEKNDAIFTKE